MNTKSRLLFPVAASLLAAATSAQHVLLQYQGSQAGAGFGKVLGVMPDLDQDGVRELLVGVPDFDGGPALPAVGEVQVRSGRTGYQLRRCQGQVITERMGQVVVGTGDLNGDGVPDFAASSPSFGAGQGKVLAVSGADGSILSVWTGDPLSEFGSALAGIDDVTGDGRADLAVGAPRNSLTHAYGTVRFFSVGLGVPHHEAVGTSNSRFGSALVLGSDLDTDGKRELMVGEPGIATFGADSGEVSMRTTVVGAGRAVLWRQFNFPAQANAGSVMAAAGDFDGDGAVDVLVTAGDVYVLSGRTGAILLQLPQAEAGYGTALAGIGDFDGDGRDDFAIGSPLHGALAGRVTVRAGGTGALLATIDGSANELLGASLAGPGDLDGDGRADLAIGSPGVLANGQMVGRVSIHGYDVAGAVTPFGQGCNGGTAVTPLLSNVGRPIVGAQFLLRCTNLSSLHMATFLFGFSNTSSGGVPLPLDLAQYGMPGCQLLAAPDVAVLVVSSGTVANLQFPTVPTAVYDLQFFAQALVFDPAAAGGVKFSRGLGLHVGSR